MTLALLVIIALMWIPVGLLFLGKGEAKGTGAATALVGAITIIGGILQVAVFKDAWVGAVLIAFGILYAVVAYALLAGLDDLKSVGNVALAVGIICAIYAIVFFTTGALGADGKPAGPAPYFGFCFLAYTILCLAVFLNAHGKCGAALVAWLLIIESVLNLWVPAFSLMVKGTLPF